jgi:FkbM family methyltransferase
MKLKYRWLMRVRPAFVASIIKKLLKIKRTIVQSDSGKFYIDPLSNFGNAVLSEDGYEPEMVDSIKQIMERGDTFLDIGANEGFYSILASKLVGESGNVICIEPQSRLQSVIFRNIHENHAYNINVFQKVISDSVGTATLFLLPDMNTGGSGLFKITKYKVPTEIIPQTTLSEFMKLLAIDKIKLMKIDVEGFEYEAILGSKKIFTKGIIENIALELHPSILAKRKKQESDILDFLKESGYEINTNYKTLILSRK